MPSWGRSQLLFSLFQMLATKFSGNFFVNLIGAWAVSYFSFTTFHLTIYYVVLCCI